jgi:hypothetical protein
MCEHFAPNFGDKRTGYCITTVHSLTLPFTPGIFFTKNMTADHYTFYFSVFPIDDKIEMLPF